MTPEQINKAIHEALGNEVEPCTCTYKSGRDAVTGKHVPNYHGDLDAMHEAEQAVWNQEWNLRPVFVDHLARIINPVHGYHNQSGLDLLDATAAQRAEAFLRTIGKWKEQP